MKTDWRFWALLRRTMITTPAKASEGTARCPAT